MYLHILYYKNELYIYALYERLKTICVCNVLHKRRKLKPGTSDLLSKRFDRGNCNCYGLFVPKSKREGRRDIRKPAVPRTNLLCL
jgi:hypothetical protein